MLFAAPGALAPERSAAGTPQLAIRAREELPGVDRNILARIRLDRFSGGRDSGRNAHAATVDLAAAHSCPDAVWTCDAG